MSLMTLEQVQALLEGAGVEVYQKSMEDLAILCPFCPSNDPDTSGKCYVSPNKFRGIYHCFRCDASGQIRSLFRHFGISAPGVTVDTGMLQERIIKAEAAKAFKEDSLPKKLKHHLLPKEYEPLKMERGLLGYSTTRAREWLHRRGVTPSQVLEWRIGICKSGPYAQRIVLPVFDAEGKIQTFQARMFLGSSKMKSKNPYSEEGMVGREEVLYGIHRIKPGDSVVLVEGPFDVLHLQRCFTKMKLRHFKPLGLFSHHLSKIQKATLAQLDVETIWAMMDSDAVEASWKIARRMSPMTSAEVRVAELEEGDPDGLSPLQLGKILQKSPTIISFPDMEKKGSLDGLKRT